MSTKNSMAGWIGFAGMVMVILGGIDFFQGLIALFARDSEMQNIVLTDPQIREQTIRHFFNRAVRAARM